MGKANGAYECKPKPGLFIRVHANVGMYNEAGTVTEGIGISV
jgi:hypothetical protein